MIAVPSSSLSVAVRGALGEVGVGIGMVETSPVGGRMAV